MTILDLRRAHDLVAKMPAEVLCGTQIDTPAPELAGQLLLDPRQRQHTWDMPGLEFHQQVHVAVGTRRPLQDRPEQRQSPDMVASAELSQRHAISEEDVRFHAQQVQCAVRPGFSTTIIRCPAGPAKMRAGHLPRAASRA